MHALAERTAPNAELRSRPEPAGRHIVLRVDPSEMRRAHHEMAARLAANGARISLVPGQNEERLPPAVDLVLELERIIYRLHGPRPSDRQPWDAQTLPRPAVGDRPDLVFDFSGSEAASEPAPEDARVLRPLFDGAPGQAALLGALTAGRMPIIEIEDVDAGVVVARAAPRAENTATITEGLDCALARLVTLVTAAARRLHPLAPLPH